MVGRMGGHRWKIGRILKCELTLLIDNRDRNGRVDATIYALVFRKKGFFPIMTVSTPTGLFQ
jgi:hypothetical protein